MELDKKVVSKKVNITFAYLNAYADVGGIQRFNRNLIQGLAIISSEQNWNVSCLSLNDSAIPQNNIFFKTASGNKLKFLFTAVWHLRNQDKLILGHVNLLFPLVLIAKLLNPGLKVILITHGIEIWKPLSWFQQRSLKLLSFITAVSNFTKKQIENKYGQKYKVQLFPNCISYDFNIPDITRIEKSASKNADVPPDAKILLTVTRVAATESKKGYDLIVENFAEIKKNIPNAFYMLAGKADENERGRLQHKIQQLGISDSVCITGLISDAELFDLYSTADAFILPSQKEGFGIVFLEAMCYGLPVIGGNKDGSVDALMNGELGKLVDPDSAAEIVDAVITSMTSIADRLLIQKKVLEHYSFDIFVMNIKKLIEHVK